LIVVDTTVLVALLDSRDSDHEEASTWYRAFDGELVTTPLVLAEVDYLAQRAGWNAVRAFRRDVAAEAYVVEWWPSAAQEAVDVAEQYEDLGLSFTDASLVALAAHINQTEIATFDERHFRAVRPLTGDAFSLLPRDAALA
jgi:predicted nucleic acid-binding protein